MMNKLSKEIYQNNIAHGFYEDKKNIGEMLCLIHSEVSEALEADRKDRYIRGNILAVTGWVADADFIDSFIIHVKGTFEEEIADIIIRVLDLCAFKGINIEEFVKAKMRYNSLREYKHSKKY